uniref:RUN domain-containing protein n=1 Tax=Syphacia muris TaxID=451379 RepID=A0A0N5AD65_9BILA
MMKGNDEDVGYTECDRLHELEEEQERLCNSLISLTTHFAQVQFRLKQISQADGDKLLKELEEFAFKGCADLNDIKHQKLVLNESSTVEESIAKQKERQLELLSQLKGQLEDLEKYAYEMGEGDLPSSQIIAKQKAVIDKLHERMQLNLEFDTMSPSELQKEVDDAIKQLTVPIKEKDRLLEQLQTQIRDLERFVNYLQDENNGKSITAIASEPYFRPKKNTFLKLAGCGSRRFERNELKDTVIGNHYGDALAQFKVAVDATTDIMEKHLLLAVDSRPSWSRTDEEECDKSDEDVIVVVRKELCPSLRALLEHGMNNGVKPLSTSFIPFGCFSARSKMRRFSRSPRPLNHVWDVILYYYDTKNEYELGDIPVRKLSQSFQLESVAGHTVTSKQVLLSTVESILTTHKRLKRSSDAMWKAFVCAALNERKLSAWIRIIFRNRQIVENCYSPWAYIARTGFEDCSLMLDKLRKYTPDLPVDLAVRPFYQMKDAF